MKFTLQSIFSCTDSSQQESNSVRLCIEKTMAPTIPFCSTGGRVAALCNWHFGKNSCTYPVGNPVENLFENPVTKHVIAYFI